MSIMITDECISCNACEAECPNTAIYSPGLAYNIGGKESAALSEEHTYIVEQLMAKKEHLDKIGR